jgi:hypothetical protein
LRKETVFLPFARPSSFLTRFEMNMQLPDIFTTSIVNEAFDAFWQLTDKGDLTVKDTLVISAPFEPKSAEENQLFKMLGACKLTQEHFQIVQLKSEEQIAWHQLREQTKATKVLLLGVLPAQLGIVAMMILHEVNNFDGVQWMPTFSLNEITTNDALKKHLWVNVFQKVYF